MALTEGARNVSCCACRTDVANGDEVVFSKYGGTEINLGTDEVLILRESDVLAKVALVRGARRRKSAAAA